MYIEGFVLPVPTDAKDKFRRYATAGGGLFKKHGATELVEAWNDDVPDGVLTSFPLAVKKTPEESVVFAYVVWPDKAARDAGMAAISADTEFMKEMEDMPVDGKRMIFGGFEPVVDVPGPAQLVPGNYLDGFVAAVPDANREAFIKHATEAANIFVELGALRSLETWAVEVPDGVHTSFPMAVKKEAGESVVFSFVAWPDKATRDAGWQKVMADPRMQPENNPMPFDGKRMIFGGFDPIVIV